MTVAHLLHSIRSQQAGRVNSLHIDLVPTQIRHGTAFHEGDSPAIAAEHIRANAVVRGAGMCDTSIAKGICLTAPLASSHDIVGVGLFRGALAGRASTADALDFGVLLGDLKRGAMDTTMTTGIAAPAKPRTWGRTIRAYVALTKPRVLELLLVTTVPVMILAQNGMPNLWLVLATVIGGSASAGSAAAFNMYLDRDMDAHMQRTVNRPLVTGEVTPRAALIFAWTLAAASTVWLLVTTNWLTAVLSVSAIFFYVVIYTMILKRRTEQNIVWGGIAGCFPVVIGWSAVTGSLSWSALILFALVFLWTPPHYWPLSMKYKTQYEEVDVPMLGATRSAPQVGLQVILYAWATVACSLLLIPVAHMGIVYTASALVFGGWFIYESHRLYNRSVRGTEPRPMRVFHASITYLTLLFVAIAVDPLLPF